MSTLIRLEVIRIFRNKKVVFFTLLYPAILYMIFAQSSGRIGGLSVKLYVMVSMAAFGAVGATLMSTAQGISQERAKGWVRQLRLTALNQNGYVISKIIAAAATSGPAIAVVMLVGGLVNGVRMPAWQWPVLLIALWLGSLVFAALGVALGYLGSPSTIQPILMICYLGLSLLGGLWMPTTGFPTVLRKISEAMPTYRFGAIGRTIEAGQFPHGADLAVLAGYLVVFVVLAGRLYRRDRSRA
ncbi:ABC transporter [Mangrovactinospora gilvigrisea]|uniref:ABC transporter n=1 Tax=Mangrovactinospora gilvigrisea TaxID=1428644 RepID=A0A1J7C713_9ACTN|nr:ABC transporter permease [Mangrovactinospora gilvigrisea]OIV37344.1 ABC transporter [Mangrovactinospora gilvigrisea]